MNHRLYKILTGLLGAFLIVSCLLYYGSFGLGLPEPVSHAKKLAPKEQKWSFDGPTGTFDRESIQRGYKVYKEVCSSCHSMKLVAFRNLKGVVFQDSKDGKLKADDMVKALAAEYTYPSIGEDGSNVDRKGLPSDHFKSPYDSKEAAAAANGGAVPPDLSLMVKAREDGPNYIYSILTGYNQKPPADTTIPAGKYFNPYYPGQVISMPQPLHDGQVDFEDGTKNDIAQEAHDVVNFLQWTAEPEMELRKRMGIKVIAFLSAMTVFFYIAKVRIWARVK